MRVLEPSPAQAPKPPRWLVEDHELLCRATREAGALASKRFHAGEKGWEKRPGEPVSEADLAVDAYLKAALIDARPGYGWLSEESGGSENTLAGPRVPEVVANRGTPTVPD